MRIKITKAMNDIPVFIRPRIGYVFDVLDVLEAGYNPIENNMKVIEVKGRRICVLASECEVVKT